MNDSTVEKSILGIGSYEPGTWLTDQEQAFEYAAQSGKIVFFIGDYASCPYAKKMWSELLTQPDFLEYAKENFILLHVTTAISPVVRLFDPQGVEITQRLGFASGHSDIWLQWLKIPYAQITGVLVDSGTSSFANKTNLWQNDTVKAKESAFVACNGVISNIEILGEGFLEVHSGGIAKNTTVQNLAEMYVINGVARKTTANSGGHIYVHHSGKLEDSLINRGGVASLWKDGIAECTSVEGDLIVESGGSAISTFVNSNGYIHISSGGTAVATTNSGLGYVFNGGSACQTKLDDNSMLFVMQGGKTMQTEVNASAMEYISSGGYAEQTCVNVGGTLLVEGGSAVMIKENGGWVSFFSDANVSFQQNIFSGVNLSKTGATVHSGTIARNTRINAAGSMHVFSGGLADCTVVNSGILSISSGGTASGTLLNYDGTMSVFAGGLAVGTEMTGIAKISGNIKDSVISNGGLMQIQSGGCAEDTKVFSGGIMYISSGAVHRGYLDLESSVRVSAYTGAIIDFTLSNRKSSDEYLINNFALIAGTPTYTITVSENQAMGTYKLANGVSSFTETITIGSSSEIFGTISLNTKTHFNGVDYRLTLNDQSLILQIADLTPPAKPTVLANITSATNQDVIVSATFSSDSIVKEYSLDNKSWQTYTDGIKFEQNGTVYFRGTDEAGNVSEVTEYNVANIDKVAPTKPVVTADTANPTNSDVTVTAMFSNDSTVKQYRIGDDEWQDYGGAFTVSKNVTIYFRAEDAAGNESTSEIVIANIDKTAPAVPDGFNETISGYNATLDWSDASDTGVAGVKGYYVRYGTSETLPGEGKFIAASEFNVADLAVGTYYYQVKTADKAGNISEWSAVQSFEIILGAVQNLRGDSNCLSWDAIPGVESYIVEYSTDNFANVMSFETTSNKVDSIALPVGTYQWRVKAINGENFSTGENIISQHIVAEPQEFVSNADGNTDVFYANANGRWSADYEAQHLGVLNGWSGTNEQVTLYGKNKLADIFEGSSDANILVMTDDTNGDALFVDDIYTALPGTVAEQQARIAQIDEIRAGVGDDIVDMTSQRFEYVGDGVKIYGGLGNDTIWSNNGNNTLFGDAGNDRLVGASGNDVIIGGSGNDSLHGGGGDDIFCFGENWGKDTVEQLVGGEITLWFESGSENNWNADTLTYTDGTNSVKVSGISADNISLKFGDDNSLFYDELANSGCFDDAASEKIFEDKNKGVLA